MSTTKVNGVMGMPQILFLEDNTSQLPTNVTDGRDPFVIAALSCSVLIHIVGAWFCLHLASVPHQHRTRPIEVTIVSPPPEKKIVPIVPSVLPRAVEKIRPISKVMSVPAPIVQQHPKSLEERPVPAQEPKRLTDKPVQASKSLPVTTSAGPAHLPTATVVQHPQVQVQTRSTGGGAPASKDKGEGQQVVGPSYDAAYLSNPAPKYPAAARRLKLQGTATLRVFVSMDGHPQSVAVEHSSGTRILDDAALEAVQHWTFVPARRGSKPIAAEVDVPVRFRLN